ncbi:MAG: hypothetical protein AB7G93_03675 [Bdellovibrionales bacterium]
MKPVFVILGLFLGIPAFGSPTDFVWGTVEFPSFAAKPTRVTLAQNLKTRDWATMTWTHAGGEKTHVPLSQAQFREVTAWLRMNYIREREMRNNHKESVKCRQFAGYLKIEPGLFTVNLCQEVARHHSLAVATARFLAKYVPQAQLVAFLRK